MNLHLLSPDAMDRLAWALAHFLWQGALIAMAAAAALRVTARRSPRLRYALAVAALAAMLAAPAATFLLSAPGAASAGVPRLGSNALFSEGFSSSPVAPGSSAPFPWTQWAAFSWMAGVLACSLRLAAGWQLTRRMIRSADLALPAHVNDSFHRLLSRLGLDRPVRLLLSSRVDTPVTLGWLRPVVLLPLSALTGLDAGQLRAVLAHELAHVRRHDFLVNFLQRCVEALLFYHPAVWWLSARIRQEREHCCDDLALEVCGDPAEYARALLELERARSAGPSLALAASGGDLPSRVRRILGRRDSPGNDWVEAAAVAGLIAVLLLAGASDWNPLQAQDAPPVPPAPPAPVMAAVPPQPPPPPVAMAAAAAMPAPPQPPPPPPPQDSRSVRVSRYDDTGWVMFRGGKVLAHGSPADEAEARIARRAVGGDMIWLRLEGNAYVIRDAAIMDKVARLFEPLDALGNEQRALGEQQRALGEEQRKLGEQMRAVKVNLPDLEAQLDQVRAELKTLQSGATQHDIGRLQRRFAELQSTLGRLQGQAGAEQGRLGQQQGELGRKQGELGRRQGELGRKQAAESESANRQTLELLREAVKSGRAKPTV